MSAVRQTNYPNERYIFNTYKDWKENEFPFFSVPTIERSFTRWEKRKFIVSAQPEGRLSRRKWYRLSAEGIKLMDSGKTSKCDAPIRQNEGDRKPSNCGLPDTNKKIPSNTITRPQAASATRKVAEDHLLKAIREICGSGEMNDNGGMWRDRARENPRALANAIEDWRLRSDNYHLKSVQNPGAWLTAAFNRTRDALHRSQLEAKSPDAQPLSEQVREALQSETPT